MKKRLVLVLHCLPTILVIGFGPLLRINGVLERLEPMPVAIEGPRE